MNIVIRIATTIFISYCLTGCITKSLLNNIEEEQTTSVAWKKDSIMSIKPSTTISGEKTWTLIGKDNSYQLDTTNDYNSTSRNIVTLLYNKDLEASRFIFPTSFGCRTDSKSKSSTENHFSCGDLKNVGYIIPKTATDEQKEQIKNVFLAGGMMGSPYYIKLSGTIKDPEVNHGDGIFFSVPREITFWRKEKSFSAKALLLPFTVIADVVTSPFQAIGYLIIMNSIPKRYD
ncbi:hypothetical protein Q6W56_003851 [Salmonella enterica]|nr:hypothetical protein [Salmonella enterica subsp. enterica serovar Inganda]EJE9657466.1 hypothetical protein [Salmonella enterica]EJE9775782.1 hypothetical protein [Salmonella enterica]EJF5536105.1 hypothetical protein [Salmonella enterica]EJX5314224.1 hypothetical protein [Salmonella enterica]